MYESLHTDARYGAAVSPHTIRVRNTLARTGRLLMLSLLCAAPLTARDAAVTEATVVFEIDYEDLGPMGAMLPKTERVQFRPGQMRIETGMNVELYGVVPGHKVSLMALAEHKVAFVVPDGTVPMDSGLRYEAMDERRTIAGLPAHQVDGVDPEDETNRVSYWLTDRLAARYPARGDLPEGFALDYLQFINDGTAHKVATSVDTTPLAEHLFAIPEGYRRIEVESERDIAAHLKEIMGGQVQVVE